MAITPGRYSGSVVSDQKTGKVHFPFSKSCLTFIDRALCKIQMSISFLSIFFPMFGLRASAELQRRSKYFMQCQMKMAVFGMSVTSMLFTVLIDISYIETNSLCFYIFNLCNKSEIKKRTLSTGG